MSSGSRRCARSSTSSIRRCARRWAGRRRSLPPSGAGYSGVAIYSREPPTRTETALGRGPLRHRGAPGHRRLRPADGGVGLLPEGQRARPGQPPRPLQARLLRGALRPPAGAAAPRPGARHRRLQHGARADRSRPPGRQHEDQRLPARGARGADALDRRGLGGHVPRPPSRRGGTLHLVAAVGRRPREQRGVAHRLRARVPGPPRGG